MLWCSAAFWYFNLSGLLDYKYFSHMCLIVCQFHRISFFLFSFDSSGILLLQHFNFLWAIWKFYSSSFHPTSLYQLHSSALQRAEQQQQYSAASEPTPAVFSDHHMMPGVCLTKQGFWLQNSMILGGKFSHSSNRLQQSQMLDCSIKAGSRNVSFFFVCPIC